MKVRIDRCLRVGFVALGVLGLVGARSARAGSFADGVGPRGLALGESLRGDARGGLAVTANPAGLTGSRELVFEGTFAHRGGDGGRLALVTACDSTVPIPGCFYYRFASVDDVGGDQWRVHEGGAVIAAPLSEAISIGVTGKYYDEKLAEDSRGYAFDVGLSVHPSPMVGLGLVAYNVVRDDTAYFERGYGAGVSVRALDALAFSADGVWNTDGNSDGRYGGGVEYFLPAPDRQSGYPLRLGGVYDTTFDAGYVTGGIGFLSGRVGLDIGIRRQVSEGDETLVQASLRFFGPVAQQNNL